MHSLVLAFKAPYRMVAGVTLIALLAWTLGLPTWIHTARAVGLADVSDVLSDSDYGVNSEHSITFTTATALTAGQLIRVTFDPAGGLFDLTGLVNADVSTSTTHTIHDAVGTCGAGTDLYVNNISIGGVGSDYIEYAVCTGDTLAGGSTVNFSIGAEGANDINNPTPASPGGQSYVIRIVTSATPGGAAIDEADTRVAIIEDVTVTAAVDTIFTFTIKGLGAGVAVNDESETDTTGTSTATTVPFGILDTASPSLLAQILEVDTNALNGFSVTVQADQTLTAGNTATIDTFTNGTNVASSTTWSNPTGLFGSTLTYGHWGLTSDDNVVSSTTPNLWGSGQALYVGNFVNNPVEVFYHDTAVLKTSGTGVGSTTVAYKVRITALQEAAKDYTATLTYIATPVF